MDKKLQTEADYLYCEHIIKKHSKSFYFAFSTLPKEKAQAVYAVYAFCRFADDSVDDNPTQAEQIAALERVEQELALFEAGEEVDHPLWRALRDVFQRYDMALKPFYDQLRGQRMDVQFASPRTVADLETYSALVAGSVGQMLLPIIASDSEVDLTEVADNLGIAMQITNILRDVGEDSKEKDRIYLPLAEIERHGYSTTALKARQINEAFIALWESLAGHAETLYDQFEAHLHHFDEDSQRQVVMSARVYREILNEVRRNDYDCFNKRNFVSRPRMLRLTRGLIRRA